MKVNKKVLYASNPNSTLFKIRSPPSYYLLRIISITYYIKTKLINRLLLLGDISYPHNLISKNKE